MTTSQLPYDSWLEDALRGLVRRALQFTADHGLPGEHHFYLTFATGAPGVEISPELRASYPDEMTIVLQHQFWDLNVEDERFSVTLKFRGRMSRLVVPFTAISAFGDPSVSFGLHLKALPMIGAEAAEEDKEDVEKAAHGQVIALDTFRKK